MVAIHAEGLVRVAEQYLRRGSKVYLEGKLETREWQDQSGQDRYSTEVVLRPYGGDLQLLDRRDPGDTGRSAVGGYSDGRGAGGGGGHSDMDHEISF